MVDQKPTFNVSPTFMNITVVQFNYAMSLELQKFINSIDDVESEIVSLQRALRNPADNGLYYSGESNPSFSVSKGFKGVVVLQIDNAMKNLLIDFIEDIDGVNKEIWAFKNALQVVQQSRQARQNVLRRRRNESYDTVASPTDRKKWPLSQGDGPTKASWHSESYDASCRSEQ